MYNILSYCSIPTIYFKNMGCSCDRKQLLSPFHHLQTSRLILIMHSHQSVAVNVLSYLTLPELGKASIVCRLFNKIAGSQQLLQKYRKTPNVNHFQDSTSPEILNKSISAEYVPQPNEDCDAVVNNTDNMFFGNSNLNTNRNGIEVLITPKFCTLVGPITEKDYLSDRVKSVKCIFISSSNAEEYGETSVV